MSFKEITDKSIYFKTIENFEIIPFTQLKGMCDMYSLSGENRIHFFINSFKNPTIGCFGHEKKLLFLGVTVHRDCVGPSRDFPGGNRL